ncbi:hypothetical protein J4402_03475 [Candidatus Pacearchaeota archaeon]|nr:hypothetical protein [Candidatus Pacearchaeota archaeon]
MELSENFCTYRGHKGYKSQVCKRNSAGLANCAYGISEVHLSDDNHPYLRGCRSFEANPILRTELIGYLFERKQKKKRQRIKYKKRRAEKIQQRACE